MTDTRALPDEQPPPDEQRLNPSRAPSWADPHDRSGPLPHTQPPTSMLAARVEQVVLAILIVSPLAALAAALPLLWGHWITWRDVTIAAVMYAVTGHGITIGFHRYFTHSGFKTSRPGHVIGSKVGSRPYRSRDRSANVWPLAPLSLGENWHNLHHAEPTLARHGVEPWQLDTSAYLIKVMETLRLVWDVRWPDRERLTVRLATAATRGRA